MSEKIKRSYPGVEVEWVRAILHSAIFIDGKFVSARSIKLEHAGSDNLPTVTVTFNLRDLKVRDVTESELSELVKNAQDDNG